MVDDVLIAVFLSLHLFVGHITQKVLKFWVLMKFCAGVVHFVVDPESWILHRNPQFFAVRHMR